MRGAARPLVVLALCDGPLICSQVPGASCHNDDVSTIVSHYERVRGLGPESSRSARTVWGEVLAELDLRIVKLQRELGDSQGGPGNAPEGSEFA